jgi:hypothetical protein
MLAVYLPPHGAVDPERRALGRLSPPLLSARSLGWCVATGAEASAATLACAALLRALGVW